MAKITRFDKAACRILRPPIDAALAAVGKEYGLSFALGRITFVDGEARGKLTMTVLEPGQKASEADTLAPLTRAQRFPAGGIDGITNDDIGKTVRFGNGEYRIEGYNPARPKRCILLSRVRDGKPGFVANPQEILAVMGRGTGGGNSQTYHTYPGDWDMRQGENFDAYNKRTKAMLEAIPDDRLISFPVGDGKALYYVESLRPLRLQHIPYGDKWQIPPAHYRGLTSAEVKRMIADDKAIRKLFAGKK